MWPQVLAILISGCASLRTEGRFFLDASGRVRVFHGVNVVYKTFPFYPETTGFDSNYSLSREDLLNLRNWGFNSIRLHVAWEGVEP
jgi:endoglycosylceramidase